MKEFKHNLLCEQLVRARLPNDNFY